MSSNFANSWQKHTPRNLEQMNLNEQAITSRFNIFKLHRVKASNDFMAHSIGLQHQMRSLHIKVKLSHQITIK